MATFHVITGATETPVRPVIRKIAIADLFDALRKGWDDFRAIPTQTIFLCIIYPIVGFVLARLVVGYAVLPLLFPLMAGFALVGPLAAVGIYELSRRREAGQPVSWTDAFGVLRSPSIGAIAALGVVLMILFLSWLASAQTLYQSLFELSAPDSVTGFFNDVLTTRAGWMLILLGNAIGFLFALVVLTISAVSFPMLVDRDVGAAVAVWTSIRAVLANPVVMAAWGVIVAALLVLGSLPFFVGLAIVMPLLGHATWHLYRKVVAN